MTFKQSPSGYRNVSGSVIEQIQANLNAQGFDAGTVDGSWGSHTLTAVQAWQTHQNLQPNGIIDDAAWQSLMQQPVPQIWRRALQVTAAWEGTGYGGANGNFDGQGITWGIVGFTWRNGELQGLLADVKQQYPAIFSAAFGPLEGEMEQVLGQSRSEQMTWAQRISMSGGQTLSPRWESAFAALGEHLEVRIIEDDYARNRYWAAGLRLANQFGLASDAGLAQSFDCVVQMTITDEILADIGNQISNGMSELEKMRVIATVVADASPHYHDDVLSRKMSFVTGRGLVHDDRYDLASWGIG
jgi:hypothetical protein